MKVSLMLLQRRLEQLHDSFTELKNKIKTSEYQAFEEVERLKIIVETKLQETELLAISLQEFEANPEAFQPIPFEETYRRLKRSNHIAWVNWRHFISNFKRNRRPSRLAA